jgi:hypothetical protein
MAAIPVLRVEREVGRFQMGFIAQSFFAEIHSFSNNVLL